MRILFVSRTYHPAKAYGGPVTSLRRMCSMLAQSGHDVRVICSNMLSPGRQGQQIRPGQYSIDGVKVRFLRTDIRYRWEGISAEAVREVPPAVRRADVVHVAGTRHFLGTVAQAAARKFGVPYLVMPEGSIPARSRNIPAKGLVDALITRRFLADAFSILAASDLEAEELLEWGVPQTRLLVLPPRADRIEVSPQPQNKLRDGWGIPRERVVLLWLGRINSEKGLPLLFDALTDRRLQHTILLLGSEAEDRVLETQLRKRAAAEPLNGQVRFLGWVGQKEKAELFKLSDLFVFPSRKENFGLAAAEAAAAGLPVVLTKGCGVAKLLHNRAGIAVDYDAQSLAETLISVIGDEELRRRLRAGTTEVAKDLDWPPLVAFLERVYREAVEAQEHERSRY